VHRWREVEARDPKRWEAFRRTHELQRTALKLHDDAARVRRELEGARGEVAHAEARAAALAAAAAAATATGPGAAAASTIGTTVAAPEIAAETAREELKVKARQLKEVEAEREAAAARVSELKLEAALVRDALESLNAS
jgi:hypothetical protein